MSEDKKPKKKFSEKTKDREKYKIETTRMQLPDEKPEDTIFSQKIETREITRNESK